jgi:hypothetical protein
MLYPCGCSTTGQARGAALKLRVVAAAGVRDAAKLLGLGVLSGTVTVEGCLLGAKVALCGPVDDDVVAMEVLLGGRAARH